MGRVNKASDVGIFVAGDLPNERWPDLENQLVEPVAILFVYKGGQKQPFQVPVRQPTPLEICMVVNRALGEQQVEFAFRPKLGGGPLVGVPS